MSHLKIEISYPLPPKRVTYGFLSLQNDSFQTPPPPVSDIAPKTLTLKESEIIIMTISIQVAVGQNQLQERLMKIEELEYKLETSKKEMCKRDMQVISFSLLLLNSCMGTHRNGSWLSGFLRRSLPVQNIPPILH